MNLSIYSNNFDNYAYVVGNGMNGKVFVEGNGKGRQFRNVADALDYIVENNIPFDQIVYHYQKNGEQFFKKFTISK